MKTISSRQNALYKRVRRAIDEHAEEIAIEGPKAVEDAIANGWRAVVVVKRGEDFTPATLAITEANAVTAPVRVWAVTSVSGSYAASVRCLGHPAFRP